MGFGSCTWHSTDCCRKLHDVDVVDLKSKQRGALQKEDEMVGARLPWALWSSICSHLALAPQEVQKWTGAFRAFPPVGAWHFSNFRA
jgi:hypothetical protein